MVKKIIIIEKSSRGSGPESSIHHLTRIQIQRLTEAFQNWSESASSDYIRRVRGRYWLVFLLLRFTGARIGEVLSIDDSADIDFSRNEIRIITLMSRSREPIVRTVPVPADIVSEIMEYLSHFPHMQGKVFSLDQGNFRREFYRRSEEADIPRELSHPHILRHTRAIELLRAGVPLTTVQDILGHALSSTTTIYLQRPEEAARRILKDKGLI